MVFSGAEGKRRISVDFWVGEKGVSKVQSGKVAEIQHLKRGAYRRLCILSVIVIIHLAPEEHVFLRCRRGREVVWSSSKAKIEFKGITASAPWEICYLLPAPLENDALRIF